MELSDVNALVTGGSSGIGKATARALVDAGGTVVIAARNKERLLSAAEEVGALPLRCDVCSESEVISLVEKTIEKLDHYNVLINNAGYGDFTRLVNLSATDMERQLKTNTIGAMMVARESARHFIREDYGNIINVSSSAGIKVFEGGTAYADSNVTRGGITLCSS